MVLSNANAAVKEIVVTKTQKKIYTTHTNVNKQTNTFVKHGGPDKAVDEHKRKKL